MKPYSKTDWDRVKREALADTPVPYDPETDLYDPNDPAAVEDRKSTRLNSSHH